MSVSRRDTVTVTPPKGGACHATESVANSVTSCHGLERPMDKGDGPRVESCHGNVTSDVTRGVSGDVTTLSAAQLRPLAQLIAGSLAGVPQVEV